MQVNGKLVSTPGGERWQIARVWTERKMPRWRKVGLEGGFEWLAPDGPDESFLLWLALVIGTVVVVLVVIPLLLFGIELVLLGIVIAAAILGRGLLGRPWLVRAKPVDGAGEAIAWRVVGWRRSQRVIEEVAAALSGGGTPRPLEPAERVVNRLSKSPNASPTSS
jgi:hypothetical protein